MIAKRLLENLWARGVLVVTTSNRHPDELYKNGLNRAQFLPCIADIKRRCVVHEMAARETIDSREAARLARGDHATWRSEGDVETRERWLSARVFTDARGRALCLNRCRSPSAGSWCTSRRGRGHRADFHEALDSRSARRIRRSRVSSTLIGVGNVPTLSSDRLDLVRRFWHNLRGRHVRAQGEALCESAGAASRGLV